MLRGPSGIGKSAFCRELGALARDRGWMVVRVDAALPGRAYAVIAALAERLLPPSAGCSTTSALRRIRYWRS